MKEEIRPKTLETRIKKIGYNHGLEKMELLERQTKIVKIISVEHLELVTKVLRTVSLLEQNKDKEAYLILKNMEGRFSDSVFTILKSFDYKSPIQEEVLNSYINTNVLSEEQRAKLTETIKRLLINSYPEIYNIKVNMNRKEWAMIKKPLLTFEIFLAARDGSTFTLREQYKYKEKGENFHNDIYKAGEQRWIPVFRKIEKFLTEKLRPETQALPPAQE